MIPRNSPSPMIWVYFKPHADMQMPL
jgi:hypothetical protein